MPTTTASTSGPSGRWQRFRHEPGARRHQTGQANPGSVPPDLQYLEGSQVVQAIPQEDRSRFSTPAGLRRMGGSRRGHSAGVTVWIRQVPRPETTPQTPGTQLGQGQHNGPTRSAPSFPRDFAFRRWPRKGETGPCQHLREVERREGAVAQDKATADHHAVHCARISALFGLVGGVIQRDAVDMRQVEENRIRLVARRNTAWRGRFPRRGAGCWSGWTP